ncbi:ribose-phosphate diphosphokinase [Chitinibacter sp. GC72]|uniref:ribose-phosphate diphosphokinase n=1 Tax=Chitinibacter sp. GC72 TaxID=1526917 RepID=UPI0018E029D0|nr:ribose-phosphate diphosphokinase [Chitinibacter sp. GC72]
MSDRLLSSYDLPAPAAQGEALKLFQFGSGEQHVQLLQQSASHVQIRFRYRGDASIMQLLLLTDALKRQGASAIDLLIPYFPAARQDRVCNDGEALSVKVYADLINQQAYRQVTLFDPHSDVVVALLDRAQVVKNYALVEQVVGQLGSDVVLVSPDAGANKKVFALASYLSGMPVIRADKIRDVRNGAIIDTEVFCDDLSGKTALIVDDICAGGRTFIELAKKLKQKNCARIVLAVSHFEGTANLQLLADSGIDAVFSTNSINDLSSDDFLTIFDIWSVMPSLGEQK